MLHKRIEALLFTLAEPVCAEDIATALDTDVTEIKTAVRHIQHSYKDSALTLTSTLAGWRFAVRARYVTTTKSRYGETPTIEIPTTTHNLLASVDAGDEDHEISKEFLDDLHEKLSTISHHNANNTQDEEIRARMLSELEGFLQEQNDDAPVRKAL